MFLTVQASCDFYTNKLGFKVNFAYGNPPFYGQVYRDHARLNLRLITEPVFAGDIRARVLALCHQAKSPLLVAIAIWRKQPASV